MFDHPLTDALATAHGDRVADPLQRSMLSLIVEVAVAVGARAAVLPAEVIWIWDQAQLAFEHGLGWFTFVDDCCATGVSATTGEKASAAASGKMTVRVSSRAR